MGMVNSFQGFGGGPGFSNFFTSQIATPKPAFDPTLPSGDCLQRVNNAESASQYPMNPNTRVALFNSTEDIFYVVSTDASGMKTVQAYSFASYTPEPPVQEPKYVTVEEFEKFKQEVLDGQQFIRNNRNSNRRDKQPGSEQS